MAAFNDAREKVSAHAEQEIKADRRPAIAGGLKCVLANWHCRPRRAEGGGRRRCWTQATSELNSRIQLLAKLPGLGPARQGVRRCTDQAAREPAPAARGGAGRSGGSDPPCRRRRPGQGRNLRDLPRSGAGHDDDLCGRRSCGSLGSETNQGVRGRHRVLGGTLSALDGIGPDDLDIERLLAVRPGQELIFALNETVEVKARRISDTARRQRCQVTASLGGCRWGRTRLSRRWHPHRRPQGPPRRLAS